MADIFSEVEEELRRDKYNALLRRYGLWFLAVLILAVAAAGLHQWVWEPWRNGRIHDASDRYEAAVLAREAGQTAEAEAAFAALAAEDHAGYATLSLLQQAEMAEAVGDRARAADLYNQAADSTKDETLSGYARIRALYAMADEASYDEVLVRAEPLAGADSGFRSSARELIAAAALRAGDFERAESEYQYLTLAPETPPGIRARAGEGLAVAERGGQEAAQGGGAPAEPAASDAVTEESPS